MGNYSSGMHHTDIDAYVENTYLNEDEVNLCAKNFKLFAKNKNIAKKEDFDEWQKLFIDKDIFIKLPEFKVNPFRDQIYEVFKLQNGDGNMYFEDYLDMMSVFSPSAPENVKIQYAFKIYTFGDEVINKDAIISIIRRLTKKDRDRELADEDCKKISNRILKEAALTSSETISYEEFKLVISLVPDFADLFCVRVMDVEKE